MAAATITAVPESMLETVAEGSVDTKVPGVEITTGSNMATEGMERATGGGKVVGTETAEATAMIGTTIGDTIVAIVVFVAGSYKYKCR